MCLAQRLPLSVVECSQFLGICGLPGEANPSLPLLAPAFSQWTFTSFLHLHAGCKYKDVRRSLERDVGKMSPAPLLSFPLALEKNHH